MKLTPAMLLLSGALCACSIVQAQTSSDLQSFILPSPNVMTYQKYVDYPVDFSTGAADISVPLYAIKLKDYSYPISASFHASGRTTSFNFSPLGMNWALQAFGMISVEIRGRPDSKGYAHVEKSPLDYDPQYNHYLDLIAIDESINASGTTALKDSEYDIYTLNLNGIFAKFIRKDNGQIVFLTYCPYKVVIPGSYPLGAITVTDDKGYVYLFGADGAGNGGGETDFSVNGSSSWFIATITTPSSEKISFKYGSLSPGPQTFLYIGNRIYKDFGEIKDCDNFNSLSIVGGGSGQSYFNSLSSPLGFISYNSTVSGDGFSLSYISEIDFPNGKINFTYNSTPDNFLLDKFVVTNLQNDVVRTGHFDFENLPGENVPLPNNNSKTILDIIFRDNGNADVEKYSFDYYPGIPGGDVVSFAKAKDWWGYCNSSPGGYGWGTRHLAYTSINVLTAGGGNSVLSTFASPNVHSPDLASKLVGMIKTVHFPTGGTADYTYEKNEYLNYQLTPTEGPGIRVKQILYKDGYGKKTGKVYSYTPGSLVREPLPDDYFIETRRMLMQDGVSGNFTTDFVGSYRYRIYTSEPIPAAAIANRYPVYYSGVTVTDYSDDGVPNGNTSYSYTFPSRSNGGYSVTSPSGCACSVTLVTGGNEFFQSRSFVYDEFTRPQLSGKGVRKYDPASSSFKMVSGTAYTFTSLNQISIPQTSIYKFVELPLNTNYTTGSSTSWYYPIMTGASYRWQLYNVMDKPLLAAVMKPAAATVTTYDDNGSQLSSVTNYYYDNLVHVNPTRTATTTSDGRTLTKYATYAQDYPAGTSFIDGLVSRNMLSVPIEEVQTSTMAGTTRVLSGRITTYTGAVENQMWRTENATPLAQGSFKLSNRTAGVLPPSGSASAFSQDASYTLRLTNNVYDTKNNPLTITPVSNFPVAYQWGYNQQYPVMEVKNAVNKNTFYTGFEEGDGNSSAGDSKAGVYSHTSTAYSKSLTGLDNGSYILSYWQKSGGVWNLVSNTVAVTTGAYTISLAAGPQVDELRFYPATATMKTYTFQPLVGMTSQCDEKDMFTYYEYDTYGRIGVIRDKDRNIVKRVCYDIMGVSNNCEIFWNDYQLGTFTKTNCSCTSIGQSVPFSVPAHTYHAYSKDGANTLALNYISANGQTYANNQPAGTYCTPINSQAIRYTNNVNDVICVTFTNTCTNTPYSYSLAAHTSPTTPVNLTTLPPGKYNISIGECSHTRPYSFTIGSNSASNTTNANFSNVIFTGTTTIYVN